MLLARPFSLAYFNLKLKARFFLALDWRSQALAAFDRMLLRWPLDAYALASRAHVLAQQGRKRAAVEALQLLVSAHPEDASAWFNLAYLLSGLDLHEESEPAFRRAVENDPQMDRAWYGMALMLIRSRRYTEAVEALKKNIQLQPLSPYGLYQLGRVHADLNDADAAREVVAQLKRFEPQVAAQLEREINLKLAASP